MKKQILLIVPLLLFIACNKPTVKSEAIVTDHFYGNIHIQYIDSHTAYSFGNGDFEDNPKIRHYINNRTSYAIIYKTIDGGYHWKEIHRIKDFSFYETTCLQESKLYITLMNRSFTDESYNSKILSFDLKTEEVKTLNYKFEKGGCCWSYKDILKVFCEDKNRLKIMSFNSNLDSMSSFDLNRTRIISDIINVNGNNYALTESNQLYAVDQNVFFKLKDRNYIQFARSNENELVLISQDKEDDADKVYIDKFNLKTHAITPVCEYKGYTIIEKFKSNDKVIVGFIGNIEGIFTSYDMIYSLDKGNTWHKHILDDENFIRPTCLIDTTLYIRNLFAIRKLTFCK